MFANDGELEWTGQSEEELEKSLLPPTKRQKNSSSDENTTASHSELDELSQFKDIENLFPKDTDIASTFRLDNFTPSNVHSDIPETGIPHSTQRVVQEVFDNHNHLSQTTNLPTKDNRGNSSNNLNRTGSTDGEYSSDEDENSNKKKRLRRTASEIERNWKCDLCNKAYGSEGALKTHIRIKHPGAKQKTQPSTPYGFNKYLSLNTSVMPFSVPSYMASNQPPPPGMPLNFTSAAHRAATIYGPNFLQKQQMSQVSAQQQQNLARRNSVAGVQLQQMLQGQGGMGNIGGGGSGGGGGNIRNSNSSSPAPGEPPSFFNPNVRRGSLGSPIEYVPPPGLVPPQQTFGPGGSNGNGGSGNGANSNGNYSSNGGGAGRQSNSNSPFPNSNPPQNAGNAGLGGVQNIGDEDGKDLAVTKKTEEAMRKEEENARNTTFLPVLMLKIGSFTKTSVFCGDLVAAFSYKDRKFSWEIFAIGSLLKMEIPFEHVNGVGVETHQDGTAILIIQLAKPPNFWCGWLQPHTPTTWTPVADFTHGQASRCRHHVLHFVKTALNDPLQRLLQQEERFRALAEKGLEEDEELYFRGTSVDDIATTTTTSSSTNDM